MLQSFGNQQDISFNPELIDESTIEKWSNFTIPKTLETIGTEETTWLRKVMETKAFAEKNVEDFYDDDAVKNAIREAIDFVSSEEEFKGLLQATDATASFNEIYGDVKGNLLSGNVDEDVAKNDFDCLDQIKLVEKDGVFECYLDKEMLITGSLNTQKGRTIKIVLQIAIVFLDVVTVIMAAAGILAEKGAKFAKKFVAFAEKISNWFVSMMEKFWAKLSSLFSKIRLFKSSGESSKIILAVKSGAKDVAAAIVAIISWAKKAKKFEELKSACSSAVGVMLSSGWKKFKACCQLIASLILLCVSGGTSLVLKIIQLVAGLVSLLLDSIDLHNMLHPEKSPTPA